MTMQNPGPRRAPFTTTEIPEDGDLHDQAGALCRDAAGAVLLVTSLTTGRWVLPKGWPMPGLSLAQAALQEAWEEAGVRGSVAALPMGRFFYTKPRRTGDVVTCRVWVFPVQVQTLAASWPEADRRQRLWLPPAEAARAVLEPGLRALLVGF